MNKKTRQLISEAEEVYVSSASIWESAIKIQLSKLNANIFSLVAAIEKEGFIELPISAQHAMKVVGFLSPKP